MNNISELKDILKEMGKSQNQFAKFCGITRQQLSTWVTGKVSLTHKNYILLQEKLEEFKETK